MSFNSSKRKALDRALPLPVRIAHARSCAMLVSHKWSAERSKVIEAVRLKCGVDLTSAAEEHHLSLALAIIEDMKKEGIPR